MKTKSKNCSKAKIGKGYVHKDMPLYDKDSFLYYFEARMKEMVRNEIEANYKQIFFNMPF
jgi:hypothetical protein